MIYKIKIVYFKDKDENEKLNFDRYITVDELITNKINSNKSPQTEFHHFRFVLRNFKSLPLCENGVCDEFKAQTTDTSNENLNIGITTDKNTLELDRA